MSIKRIGTVRESRRQLDQIARRYRATKLAPRIAMLIAIASNPTWSVVEIASLLDAPPRTVRRWWALYKSGGLERLLPGHSPAAKADVLQHADGLSLSTAMREFLNSLPQVSDAKPWLDGLREGLENLLPDVDRVSAIANYDCPMDEKGTYVPTVSATQHFLPSPDEHRPPVVSVRSIDHDLADC